MSNQELNTQTSPPKTFIDYQRTRVNNVAALQRLQKIAQQVSLDEAIVDLIEKALERNENHRFSIAVVGEFKRGKSTFINALLGKEILPADIMPCSATLNRVTYGLSPGVTIIYHGDNGDDGRVEEIGIDQLADYVTKLTPEAEETAASIKEAVVHYPLAYCQNNVEIIDTPGLNDDAAMTEVTLSVLPDVSAAILVIMATSPFSAYEADFLNNQLLLQDLGRVIFVVTGIDLMRREADKEKILKVISDRIKVSVERRLLEQFGSEDSDDYLRYRRQIGQPKIFGLSGYLALAGKEEKDSDLLAESQFPQFEEALEKFITETRGAVELQVLSNRIIAAGSEVLKKLKIEVGAMAMKQEEFEAIYEMAVAELETLRQRRDEEIKLIDTAAQRAKTRIAPLVTHLEADLKGAAEEVVNKKQIGAADLRKSSFIEGLGQEVAAAVQNAAKRNSEKIQIEIEKDILKEVERLGDFAAQVSKVLYEIEMQFVPTADGEKGAVAKDAMAVIVGGLTTTIWGGVLAGYQEAGGKGAAVGGVASLGTIMGGAVTLGLLAIPVTLPIVIGLGVAATFAGKLAARYAFREQRIEKFRQDYLEKAIAQIEQHLRDQNPKTAVNLQVSKSFAVLKEQLIGELDASIGQTQSTLDKLRSQKTRQETQMEHQQAEIEQLQTEVQGMISKAQGLSSQLADITSV